MPSPRVDVMVIGAAKAGTTSLKHYLASHPALVTHREMEFPYFSEAGADEGGFREAYEQYFADEVAKAGPVTSMLLAKHANAFTNTEELLRITAHNPSCKLILSLRDPVDRAFSAYRLDSLMGEPQPPFAAVIEKLLKERPEEDDYGWRTYLDPGCYGHHLQQLQDSVPGAALRVLFLDDLGDGAAAQMRDLYRWIGLDPRPAPAVDERWNAAPGPGSRFAARALRWLGGDTNPIKAPVRRVMPRASYQAMRDGLVGRRPLDRRRAGRGGASRGNPAEVVPMETRRKLDRFYRSDSERLAEILGKRPPWHPNSRPPDPARY